MWQEKQKVEETQEGPQAKECEQPLEAAKGKKMNSPLKSQRRNVAIPAHWF